MKAEVYIFGNFLNGYSQYPDNYTQKLFKDISKSRKAASEIVYHREGPLTYYIYLREISHSSNTFIGLCYVFNGIFIRDFSFLFDIFEDVVTNIVVKGELLEFTNDGHLTTQVNELYTNTQEIQRITEYLNSKILSLGRYAEKLPPANFSISNKEWKSYAYKETADIQTAINAYSNIRVIKGENYDSESLKGYAAKLKSQDSNIKKLQNEILNLKEKNTKLSRQKKQFTTVLFLLLLLLVGVIVFKTQISNKNYIIQQNRDEIRYCKELCSKLRSDIANLTSSLAETKSSLRFATDDLAELRDEYDSLMNAHKDLEEKNSVLVKEKQDLDERNSVLGKEKQDLERIVTNLERKVANLERQPSSNFTTESYTIGPSTSHTINGYDNGYAQWLYAKKALRINYFYVYPDKSGYVSIGLYSSSGSIISSVGVYVHANQWNKISPNDFVLNSSSKYYLAIREANGISLAYHSSTSNEYSYYQNSSLQILGSCSKGKSDYGIKYYQYFYSINYSAR